jgi:hypothetical protein
VILIFKEASVAFFEVRVPEEVNHITQLGLDQLELFLCVSMLLSVELSCRLLELVGRYAAFCHHLLDHCLYVGALKTIQV